MNRLRTQNKIFWNFAIILYLQKIAKSVLRQHFETVKTPTRLAVLPEKTYLLFSRQIFQTKNDILAIIGAKFAKNSTTFGRKRSFLCYFD